MANESAAVKEDSLEVENITVKLANSTPIWRSTSGRIEMNRLTGKTTAKTPKQMTDIEKAEVTAGIRVGRIAVAEKDDRDSEPSAIVEIGKSADLYVILDEKRDDHFITAISRISSTTTLGQLLDLEITSRNRPERIDALKERIQKVAR